ncbi:MAG: hypothetical protein ACXABN_18175 [Candidatus Thorarchaeota archaeon]|jgi:hypothetical protein
MCEWILFDGKNYPDDNREVLLYIENDCAVYFGFCERQDDKTDGTMQPDTYQWYFDVDGKWYDIEDSQVVCYLKYPMIPAELLEKAKNVMER